MAADNDKRKYVLIKRHGQHVKIPPEVIPEPGQVTCPVCGWVHHIDFVHEDEKNRTEFEVVTIEDGVFDHYIRPAEGCGSLSLLNEARKQPGRSTQSTITGISFRWTND